MIQVVFHRLVVSQFHAQLSHTHREKRDGTLKAETMVPKARLSLGLLLLTGPFKRKNMLSLQREDDQKVMDALLIKLIEGVLELKTEDIFGSLAA
ncbi:hypothetical protein IFM89_027181 [Coptis chinensis]|uniref:Uncharacterized protein n=1 Tax=Coptis chinensis TaxID=261450 RepID=A0A835IBM5_9MAGN|nr:hypothetical protein IFM89_027181 [Coptis chinensis]